MSRSDSKLCQAPRGQLTSFCLKTARGRGVVAAKQSLLHCRTRRWGGWGWGGNEWHIHQTNCQTIVCFLLRSSEYRCWTRPAEVPGLHFPSTQYRCRISQGGGVHFFSSTDSLMKPFRQVTGTVSTLSVLNLFTFADRHRLELWLRIVA